MRDDIKSLIILFMMAALIAYIANTIQGCYNIEKNYELEKLKIQQQEEKIK